MKLERKRYILVFVSESPLISELNKTLREKVSLLSGSIGLARSSVHVLHQEGAEGGTRFVVRSSLESVDVVRTALLMLPYFVLIERVSGTIAKLKRILKEDFDDPED